MKSNPRPTSTAATRRTEPAIVAGISSGEGQQIAPDEPAPRRNSRILLAAALALGAATGSWLVRGSARS
jgi:hypothetical protein